MKRVKLLMWACTLLLSTVLIGTASSNEIKVSPSLNIEVLPDGNLRGYFTKNGRTIYFETLRGELNPPIDPQGPPYELNIRVMDSNYIPFLNQIAGYGPDVLGWKQDQEAIKDLPIDMDDRLADFMILPDMKKALIKYVKHHRDQRVEIKALINLIGSIKKKDLFDNQSYKVDETYKAEARKTYKFKTTIRKKPFIKNTEHSALLVKVYDDKGRFLYQIETCNHGTCASDSKMSSKCSKDFTRSDIQAHVWDLMCDYYGYRYPTHLCNGDTREEYLSVKNGSDQDWGVCGTPKVKAPDCD